MSLRLGENTDLNVIFDIAQSSKDSLQSYSSLKKAIEKNTLFVINNQGMLAGFLMEQVVDTEAELLQIVISPSHQKQGIASSFIRQWHQLIKGKGVSEVFLEVREGNSAAQALYVSCGYETIGHRQNYYKINETLEDAILMKVHL